MKTKEMLDELFKYPEKIYLSQSQPIAQSDIEAKIKKGKLMFRHRNGTPATFLELNREWTEVKQPVTLQEALEAWAEGKKIICEVSSSIYTHKNTTTYKNTTGFLRDNNGSGSPLSKCEITNGTWYIED